MFFFLISSLCSLNNFKSSGRHTPSNKGVGREQTLQQAYFQGSASCVQNFDDSLAFAIRMTYRISLRSSSVWEPRHPLLKVLGRFFVFSSKFEKNLEI